MPVGITILEKDAIENLQRGEIADPALDRQGITVPAVQMSSDLKHATVTVMPLGGKNADKTIAALNRAKAYLRGQMGHMIALKFTPELRFIEDKSFAEAEKIERHALGLPACEPSPAGLIRELPNGRSPIPKKAITAFANNCIIIRYRLISCRGN